MSKNIDIKNMLKQREKKYIQATNEIVSHFFYPFKEAIEKEIYNEKDTQLVIQNLLPIPSNLDYVNMVLRVTSYKVGDIISVPSEDSDQMPRKVEVTEKNFWYYADTIALNIPVSVLESADKKTIIAYLNQLDLTIDDDILDFDDENDNKELAEGFNEEELDETQKSLLKLYNQESSEH